MNNESNLQGNQNIVIQGVTESTLTINVNGEVQEISNQIEDLKTLVQSLQINQVQYADKIYNIDQINEANFGVVTSNRVFNSVLCKELVHLLQDTDQVKRFMADIPPEDKTDWECKRTHLRRSQELLENKFIWVISYEIRRLFSIGNDKKERIENKIEQYIDHCFKTYRLSLQVVTFMFLSKLWDEKKKDPKLKVDQQAVRDFFFTNRPLKLKELRLLFQTLIQIFNENKLEFPLDKTDLGDLDIYLNPDSAFNKAGSNLEELEDMVQFRETYGLGHCHTAEIALSTILSTFTFFTTHQMVTMRKVEYEQTRNNPPLFVKDFNVLKRRDTVDLQRMLRYDDKPCPTYAIFIQNNRNLVNLFPFVLDYNALTGEEDFEIYFYENRQQDHGLCFFSIKKEKKEIINYKAVETEIKEIKSDIEKLSEQKGIHLDLVIKQFEGALNCILEENLHFQAVNDKINDVYNF